MMWLTLVGIYTLSGLLASLLVGGALGLVGAALPLSTSGAAWVVFATAVLFTTREFGLIELPIPSSRRQTAGIWGKLFSDRKAAALWGLDLGFLLTTRITFSGGILLVGIAVAFGDIWFGSALIASYWLGRAATVWLAPVLLSSPSDVEPLLVEIELKSSLFQHIHAVALLASAAWLATIAINMGG